MSLRDIACRIGRASRADSGQSLVELGVVMPLVCLVILSLVQFGLALNTTLEATHLANEGARLAVVDAQSGMTLQQYIQSQWSKSPQVCIDFPPVGHPTPQIGDPVRVKVAASFTWIPFIRSGVTDTFAGSATMRLEQVPSYSAGCTT